MKVRLTKAQIKTYYDHIIEIDSDIVIDVSDRDIVTEEECVDFKKGDVCIVGSFIGIANSWIKGKFIELIHVIAFNEQRYNSIRAVSYNVVFKASDSDILSYNAHLRVRSMIYKDGVVKSLVEPNKFYRYSTGTGEYICLVDRIKDNGNIVAKFIINPTNIGYMPNVLNETICMTNMVYFKPLKWQRVETIEKSFDKRMIRYNDLTKSLEPIYYESYSKDANYTINSKLEIVKLNKGEKPSNLIIFKTVDQADYYLSKIKWALKRSMKQE